MIKGSYGNGDINLYINSYLNISEKAEIDILIHHTERFSKSGILICSSKSWTRMAEKREKEEHTQLQSVMRFTETQQEAGDNLDV